MKKTTYKKIIENMVEMKVDKFVREKGSYVAIDKVELESATSDFGYPTFNCYFRNEYKQYRMHGYIDNYGSVHLCLLRETYNYISKEDFEKGNYDKAIEKTNYYTYEEFEKVNFK